MESSKDSESSDAAHVEVRLFVTGNNTWPREGHTRSALIKHFSSFGKVPDVIEGGSLSRLSVIYLIGEVAIVENVEKLNNGGCECDVEGGCKFVVDKVFPVTNRIRTHVLPCGYSVPDFHIQRCMMANEKAKMAKKPEPMKAKRKAKKPEPMKPKKKAKK